MTESTWVPERSQEVCQSTSVSISRCVSSFGHFSLSSLLTNDLVPLHNLQRLYNVRESHGLFVTGLAFARSATNDVHGKFDFSLLSISADSQVKLHQAPPHCESLMNMTCSFHTFQFNSCRIPAFYSIFWPIIGVIALAYILIWFLTFYKIL